MIRVNDVVMRVYREKYPEKDSPHRVECFSADGAKVVLRDARYPGNKAVTVKIDNIRTDGRPTSGKIDGSYFIEAETL